MMKSQATDTHLPHDPRDVDLEVIVRRAHAVDDLVVVGVRAAPRDAGVHPHKLERRVALEDIFNLRTRPM